MIYKYKFKERVIIMPLEIGIDLGTSNTIIYVKGKGIVVNEPTVVAVSKANGKILARGKEAGEMLGRTPVDIRAITPIKDGVIANFDITVALLRYFIKKWAIRQPILDKALTFFPRKVILMKKTEGFYAIHQGNYKQR